MTHVLVTAPFTEKLLNRIQQIGEELKVEQRTLPEGQWPEDWTTEAEVYYAVNGVPRPEQAPNLRWVQVHWAGVDSLVDSPLWESDIAITSASGIHAVNMAQYVFAQMLAWANKMRLWFHYQAQSEWPQQRWDKFVPDELRGRTLGILGYGSIGREVARIGKAFGMKVLVTKRNVKRPFQESLAAAEKIVFLSDALTHAQGAALRQVERNADAPQKALLKLEGGE
jgi:phosphoglycerate dehydrogenase-like enzyme